jgi:hypothetical protein
VAGQAVALSIWLWQHFRHDRPLQPPVARREVYRVPRRG